MGSYTKNLGPVSGRTQTGKNKFSVFQIQNSNNIGIKDTKS